MGPINEAAFDAMVFGRHHECCDFISPHETLLANKSCVVTLIPTDQLC